MASPGASLPDEAEPDHRRPVPVHLVAGSHDGGDRFVEVPIRVVEDGRDAVDAREVADRHRSELPRQGVARGRSDGATVAEATVRWSLPPPARRRRIGVARLFERLPSPSGSGQGRLRDFVSMVVMFVSFRFGVVGMGGAPFTARSAARRPGLPSRPRRADRPGCSDPCPSTRICSPSVASAASEACIDLQSACRAADPAMSLAVRTRTGYVPNPPAARISSDATVYAVVLGDYAGRLRGERRFRDAAEVQSGRLARR